MAAERGRRRARWRNRVREGEREGWSFGKQRHRLLRHIGERRSGGKDGGR